MFIISQVLGGINYISTVLNMRTQGMSMTKMPLTVWALFLTAVLGLLSFPVLVAAVVLLLFDRSFGTSFYLTAIFIGGQAQTGRAPVRERGCEHVWKLVVD